MLYTRNPSGSTPDFTLAYSPECVEGKCLELRLDGVLGNPDPGSCIAPPKHLRALPDSPLLWRIIPDDTGLPFWDPWPIGVGL
jgi:hypothetical protein